MIFDQFTETAKRVLVAAREEAARRRHATTGVEHVLIALAEVGVEEPPLAEALDGVDPDDVRAEVDKLRAEEELEGDGDPSLSPAVRQGIEQAVRSSYRLGSTEITSRHLMLGLLLLHQSAAAELLAAVGVNHRTVAEQLIAGLTAEQGEPVAAGVGGGGGEEPQEVPKALSAFAQDLTARAEAGELDPVVGRDAEVARLLTVLGRRSKNNPVLVGPPGVGKTALAEELARRIVDGHVPPQIADRKLWSLDLGLVAAGTRHRGDMEKRLKQLVSEVEKSQAILFVDEVHQLLGSSSSAGGLSGGGGPDVANILKPALARGEFPVVGATTDDEYRKVLESDEALSRRFARVDVGPPDTGTTVRIVDRLKPLYEQHHRVTVDDAAVRAAVELTDRYVLERYQPDKAIDLLDEASAAVAIARERAGGGEPIEDLDQLAESVGGEVQVAGGGFGAVTLSRSDVDRGVVSVEVLQRVLSSISGVPVTRVSADEAGRLLNLEDELALRVVGQDAAVAQVARAMRRSSVGLRDERRPVASFLFTGPSGVGKSELANALADECFDGSMVRLDMSEYMESHSISRMLGAPPGYVGHDEPGQLTEQLRRNPYTVVLFDEVDKAHPGVLKVLLQLLEEGVVTDSAGRRVSARDSVVILTANAAEATPKAAFGITDDATPRVDQRDVDRAVERLLPPELRGRLDEAIAFQPLGRDELLSVVDRHLADLSDRMAGEGATLAVTDDARSWLADRCQRRDQGARAVRSVVRDEVENRASEALITGTACRVDVDVDEGELLVTATPDAAAVAVDVDASARRAG